MYLIKSEVKMIITLCSLLKIWDVYHVKVDTSKH